MEGTDNIMNTYFYMDSCSQPNKYMISLNHDLIGTHRLAGSYNILMARLMHLSYADYCRMCRDLYKGEIVGKNHKYPVVYFNNMKDAQELVNELNRRMSILKRS